eukprot:PLAT13736.1.p1 GENE.PLAT13736.1~~PLAT13736.1.p1  ORF type:complete len:438 (-),score=109.47 PLAT13736.1:19-1332(-)
MRLAGGAHARPHGLRLCLCLHLPRRWRSALSSFALHCFSLFPASFPPFLLFFSFVSAFLTQCDAAYHFPNAITVIIGSVVTDAIGAGPTGVLCALAVVWGAAMVAASSSLADMMLGRVILGVGNESMNVVQFAMLSRWFSDSPSFPQLASAFSASVIIQKSGTIICFNLLPRFGLMRLHAALWSVAALCAVVVLGGALLLAWLNCLASPVLPHLRPQPPSDAEADQPRGLRGVLRRVSAFPRLYWLLAVIAVAYWSALIPFIDFSSDLFHEKWAYSPPAASRASSFIITTLLCFVPVSGHLADTYGHRVQLMLAGAALLVPVQCALALSKAMMPEVACVLIGISFALVSVPVYSCMSMVLPKQAAATGFGLAVALQNASMFAVPIAVGFLHDHSGSYTQALLLFALLASCATCACAAAAGEDVRTGGRLLSPSAGKQ